MKLSFFLFASLLFTPISYANFVVSPTQVEVDTKVKIVSYTIENKTDSNSAYKIETFERQLLPNGEEILLDTKDLRAFPSKVIVEAGKKKRIKIMYMGKRDLVAEKPYRVNFIQDDKDVSKEQGNKVNVQFEFFTSLYVQPKGIESKIKTKVVNKSGEWLLHVSNTGTKHHILNNWKIDFSGEGSLAMPPVNVLARSQIYLPIGKKLNANSAKSFNIQQN